MYHVINNRVESVPCKQAVAIIWTKGTANWVKRRGTAVAERGSTATLHPIHSTARRRPWILGGTGVCKARFQGAASPCSRWPIASFMLYGFTNPVHLHAVYQCILGLTEWRARSMGWPPPPSHSTLPIPLSHQWLLRVEQSKSNSVEVVARGEEGQLGGFASCWCFTPVNRCGHHKAMK